MQVPTVQDPAATCSRRAAAPLTVFLSALEVTPAWLGSAVLCSAVLCILCCAVLCSCGCPLDGQAGKWCEQVTEQVCPNSCSGHGRCDGGFCICDSGWFGHDCAGRVAGQKPDGYNQSQGKSLALCCGWKCCWTVRGRKRHHVCLVLSVLTWE